MKKTIGSAFLCLILAFVLSLSVFAGSEPCVIDSANVITAEQEKSLSLQIDQSVKETGCLIYVKTYLSYGPDDSYYGEQFLTEYEFDSKTDLILLVITVEDDLGEFRYFYDLYLWGKAEKLITPDEVDHILDHKDVYAPLKSGQIASGASAFVDVTRQDLLNGNNRPNPYLKALPVAAILGVLIGIGACIGVKVTYSMKHRSVDYPLDQFAKLELTERSDIFTGSYVTKRQIPKSSGSSGGGGGSSHGGGSGHAGGR